MDLKDFISKTLIDIADGVELAQQHESNGGQIAPSHHGGHKFPDGLGVASNSRIMSTIIEFDVAVITSSKVEAEGSSKGRIFVAEAGGKLGGEHSSSNATRIKFSVPFIFKPNSKEWHNKT